MRQPSISWCWRRRGMGGLQTNHSEEGRRVVLWLRLAALSGGLTVAFGAFGAHALASLLDQRARGWWSTAVDYQAIHSLALLAVALLLLHAPRVRLLHHAAALFLIGLLLFCGSLYTMALTGVTALAMVTPLGGVALLLGWLLLLLASGKVAEQHGEPG
jgi:uncharacterized membrane protein YgdD (TMEM256/DUF423 family)